MPTHLHSIFVLCAPRHEQQQHRSTCVPQRSVRLQRQQGQRNGRAYSSSKGSAKDVQQTGTSETLHSALGVALGLVH